MANSLLNPTPPSEPEDYDYGRRPPGGSPPPPAPPRRDGRGPRRRGLALLLILTALAGGVAGAGLLLLTGAGDGTTSTTTVTTPTTAAAAQRSDASAGLDARTLYANANPGESYYVIVSGRSGKIVGEKHPSALKSLARKFRRFLA